MANATPTFPGQVNSAGDEKALFLKKFAGEVLTTFMALNKWDESRQVVRSIENGSSAQFPAIGKTTASYHTPGTEILGGNIPSNERVISIDDLLVSPVFIPNIQAAMAHYDYRSEYVKQCAAALAETYDRNVAQVQLLAARASATVTGGNGGTKITSATARTDANALVAAILAAAQALDEKNVPESERSIFLLPAQYWLLFNADKITNRDFAEGNGSVASGKVMYIGGMEVVKTNHLPQTDVTAGPTAYQGDFTNTAGLVSHRSVSGTVKLIDLAVESAYDIRRQGTLVVAKYALGHGILRPESSVEIAVA